jgi:hypothetical protein
MRFTRVVFVGFVLASSCGGGLNNGSPSDGNGFSSDGGDAAPLRMRDGGGPCANGVICSSDNMTVRTCTVDGTPSQTVVQTCPASAGQTCVIDHCANACDSTLGSASNIGCEFWPVHMWNTADDAGTAGPFGVIAANTSTSTPAVVTLEDSAGNAIGTQAVQPGQSYTFMVPMTQNALNRSEIGTSFHLRSTAPIAAYEFNPVDSASALTGSASLLLPTHTLSTHYYVMSYTYNSCVPTSPPQGNGLLTVIGTQPNTKVHVTVPVATDPSSDGRVPAIAAGGSADFVVNTGEAVEIVQSNSLEDITGAEILSSRPVVAFGGSGATTVPDTATGGDHFEAQLFPTTTWGKTYECEKYQPRSTDDTDHWRVVARSSGTTVTLSDPTIATIPTLAAGQMYEFSTNKNFEMTSNQPILVGHYLEAWGALSGTFDPSTFPDPTTNSCPFAGMSNDAQCIGDANFTLAVPREQYQSTYVFYTPTTYAYDYVDVIAPTTATIMLDAKAIPALTPFGTSGYGLAQIRLQAGSHSISGDKNFGINAYGYDYAISYTYPGGLALKTLNIP